MKLYATNALETGKLTPNELGFLKSIGWEVVDAWLTRGDNPVMVCSPDRWSTYIRDCRYSADTDYMPSYWNI